MGIELKTKTGNITLTAPKSSGGGSVDLSNYYTKAQTDAKIQEVVDAIPEVDLTGYATEEYVDTAISKVDVTEQLKDYATTNYVDDRVAQDTEGTLNYVDETFVTKEDWETIIPTFLTAVPEEYLTDSEAEEKYARITDIPDVSEFITEEDIPDTSNFATKSEIPDVSAFQTEEQVIALIKEHGSAPLPVSEDGEF